MSETPPQKPEGREQSRMRFTSTTDGSGEFSERSKGLDSPRTPRPDPGVAPAAATPAQDSGSSSQAAGAAQASAVPQDGGPVNYNG
jgi:hypothetical protein